LQLHGHGKEALTCARIKNDRTRDAEIALSQEFDYLIPPAYGQVDVGSRVQWPFGQRKVLDAFTAAGRDPPILGKPILKVIGALNAVIQRS